MAVQKPKSGLTTYLLSLPPMGLLGLHRFYTGNIGTGILMLLTGGGFGIWTIYDIYQITTDKFKDGNNQTVNFLNKHGHWKSSAIFATAMVFVLSAFFPPFFIVNPIVTVISDICGLLAVSLVGLSIGRFFFDNILGGVFGSGPSLASTVASNLSKEPATTSHHPAPKTSFAPPQGVHGSVQHPVTGASPISKPGSPVRECDAAAHLSSRKPS